MSPEFELAEMNNKRWWKSYDAATKASLAILADCQDRSGVRQAMDEIDKSTLNEMTDKWAELIREAMREEGIG